MAEIEAFRGQDGTIDRTAWGHDIIARLIEQMDLSHAGISTREFCAIYWGSDREVDLELMFYVGQQLQIARGILENASRPLFLLNSNFRWYVVPPDDPAMARRFIVNRTRRILRAYERIERTVTIGKTTYRIPSADALIEAIEGQAPSMKKLQKALEC